LTAEARPALRKTPARGLLRLRSLTPIRTDFLWLSNPGTSQVTVWAWAENPEAKGAQDGAAQR
jgi:hypothetical protein